MYPDSVKASRKRTRTTFPTLALPTQGKDPVHVKEAQYLLKNNRHDVAFYDGEIDGVFGPKTGEACVHAKDVLGYPTNALKPIFGPMLRSYLVPANHPAFLPVPSAYLKTAKIRAQKPFRVVCFERALAEVGYHETPNNITKFGAEYGMNGVAWCAIFVSCMIGFDHFHYSYVPTIVADAHSGRNGLGITQEPEEGHAVCFDWQHDGVADHVGFFGGWLNREQGSFWTVEGNTSPDSSGSQSNGGGVYERRFEPRYLTEVAAFVTYR